MGMEEGLRQFRLAEACPRDNDDRARASRIVHECREACEIPRAADERFVPAGSGESQIVTRARRPNPGTVLQWRRQPLRHEGIPNADGAAVETRRRSRTC